MASRWGGLQLAQRIAVDEIGDQVAGSDVEDKDDVGMGGHGARFGLEAPSVGIGMQKLNGNIVVEPDVGRAIKRVDGMRSELATLAMRVLSAYRAHPSATSYPMKQLARGQRPSPFRGQSQVSPHHPRKI